MTATPFVLFSIGGVKLTLFGVFIGLGIFACLIATLWNGKHIRVRRANVIDGCFYALIIGLILSRAAYVMVQRLYYLDEIDKPSAMLKLWEGGYSVFGAISGAFIAMTLLHKRISFKRICDTLTPGLLIMVGIWRFAEIFSYQGRGVEMSGFFTFFPFALNNAAGTPCEAICIYESIIALLLGAYALNIRAKRRRPGESSLTAWLLFGLAQVALESMRWDSYLRIGFVKVEQVMAMVLAVSIIAVFYRGYMKYKGDWKIGTIVLALALLLIGMCVAEEFKIDGSTHLWLNYTFMVLYVLAIAALSIYLRGGWRRVATNWQASSPKQPQPISSASQYQRSTRNGGRVRVEAQYAPRYPARQYNGSRTNAEYAGDPQRRQMNSNFNPYAPRPKSNPQSRQQAYAPQGQYARASGAAARNQPARGNQYYGNDISTRRAPQPYSGRNDAHGTNRGRNVAYNERMHGAQNARPSTRAFTESAGNGKYMR